jgi:hypothetical protein
MKTLVLAAMLTALALPTAGGARATGSLALQGELSMTSTPGSCPPSPPPGASLCAARTGSGVVPGLGRVTETYTFFVDEDSCAPLLKVLETTARLEVTGKGAVDLSLGRAPDCVPSALIVNVPFTVTGGSGIYAGASGSGTLSSNAHYTMTGAAGGDTWAGTLAAPGVAFDLTPPSLTGATNKRVRARHGARRVRVAYKVIATDDVDGSVPVSCRPKSGSRFKVGRTTVRCSATDNSGNTRAARFTVLVRRR